MSKANGIKFRYPGAKPFRTNEKHIFFGRDNDIERLYKRVELEELLVLFSKSGLGKSSLLEAGLVPKVEDEGRFFPIYIRFGAYQPGETLTPLEATLQSVQDKAPVAPWLVNLVEGDETLWELLKDRQIKSNGEQNFLLIFDQFEELFSYPEEEQEAFKKALSEVLFEEIPQKVRVALKEAIKSKKKGVGKEELQLLHTPFQKRIIMAIRSDRMSELNQMVDYIPNVLKNCYELRPLTRGQATQAIQKPAKLINPYFISNPFRYKEEAMEKILNFLTKKNTQPIESFQLQILCNNIEKKVVQQNLIEVSADHIGDVEKIYQNYYDNQIDLLQPATVQPMVRKLLEEKFIFEEEHRRLSLSKGQIKQFMEAQSDQQMEEDNVQSLLAQLIETRLVRREQNNRTKGDFLYELSHDTLVTPLLRAKSKRVRAEEAVLEAKEREEELQRMREERKANEIARQKAQRRMYVSIGIGLFMTVASLIAVISMMRNTDLIQKNEELLIAQAAAASNLKEAEEARDTLKQKTQLLNKETQNLKRSLTLLQSLIPDRQFDLQQSTDVLLADLDREVTERDSLREIYEAKLQKNITDLFTAGGRNENRRKQARRTLISEYADDPEMITTLLKHAEDKISESYQESLWQSLYIFDNVSNKALADNKAALNKFLEDGKPFWGSRSRPQVRSIRNKLQTYEDSQST